MQLQQQLENRLVRLEHARTLSHEVPVVTPAGLRVFTQMRDDLADPANVSQLRFNFGLQGQLPRIQVSRGRTLAVVLWTLRPVRSLCVPLTTCTIRRCGLFGGGAANGNSRQRRARLASGIPSRNNRRVGPCPHSD